MTDIENEINEMLRGDACDGCGTVTADLVQSAQGSKCRDCSGTLPESFSFDKHVDAIILKENARGMRTIENPRRAAIKRDKPGRKIVIR